jgi:hypothetical protein
MTETESTWATRVQEWRASGLSAPAFCKDKGFCDSTLRYWASRLRKGQAGGRAAEVRLARVVRAGARPELGETPIVIEVGGARLGVRRGFDAGTLRTVLDVLGGPR